MIRITIGDFIQMRFEDVVKNFDHKDLEVEIVCDDGPTYRYGVELVYSHAYMLLLEIYDKLPRLSKYIYLNDHYNGKTHLHLLEVITQDIYHYYNYGDYLSPIVRPSKELVTMEELGYYGYKITEIIYARMIDTTTPYITTFDAEDIIEAANNKPALDALNKDPLTQQDVNKAYKEINQEFFNNDKYDNNGFVASVRIGQANINQVHKNIGPIGFMTDVNDAIFSKGIGTSYARGLSNVADKAMDSRSDAKAVHTNASLLGKAEYSNRGLQIVNLVTEEWVEGDCGSTSYIKYTIPEKSVNANSFDNFIGKYYLDEEDNILKRILPTDKEKLQGKTLKVRFILGCKHPNPAKTCRYCIGDTAMNITKGDSVGQHSTTSTTSVIEQNMISTKHVVQSSTTTPFYPSEADSRFITIENESLSIFLSPRLSQDHFKIKLALKRATCPNINDILRVSNINQLIESEISSLVTVNIVVESLHNKFHYEDHLTHVGQDGRKSYMSRELLRHVAKTGWEIDSKDMVIIDLTGFNFNKPLFKLPNQHRSSSAYFSSVMGLIRRVGERHKSNTLSGMTFEESCAKIIMETYDLIGEKFSYNIALYEGIYKGFMVPEEDPNKVFQSLRLPIPGVDKPSFADFTTLIKSRSLSARLSYEWIDSVIESPDLYMRDIHENHPFDSIYTDYESSDGETIDRSPPNIREI